MVRPAIGFTGIGAYLPPTVLTNEDLERLVNTSDDWIRRRTGIQTRRVLAGDETILDMAVSASRRALADAGVEPEQIDVIRVGVNTWLRFPSLATQLQEELGAKRASASDISAGCAAFVYAVEDAHNKLFVERVMHGCDAIALIVGVDGLSHLLDWTDRQTCVLLGDAAGAVVMQHVPEGGILATHTHADGKYGDMLWSDSVVHGQSNGDPREFTHELTGPRPYLHMEGRKVFGVAVETMVRDVHSVIDKHNASSGENLTPADVDFYYPHQANLRILEAVAKRLNVPSEKIYTEGIVKYGNTSAASIPVAYWDNRGKHETGPSRIEVDVAFGAGFASGAILRRVG